MKKVEILALNKAKWQEIAKEKGVEYTQKNTVRYLVEKVGEILGVDDKIVDLDDLKVKVHNALTKVKPKKEEVKTKDAKENKKISKPKKETLVKKVTKAIKNVTKNKSKKTVSKAKTKKETKKVEKTKHNLNNTQLEELAKNHYVKEAVRLNVQFGMGQTSSDIYQVLLLNLKRNKEATFETFDLEHELNPKKDVTETKKETEEKGETEFDKIKSELTKAGIAYSDVHTEADLKQLLNAVKNTSYTSGLPTPQPVAPIPLQNATSTLPNLLSRKKQKRVVKIEKTKLGSYRDTFMSTIKNHFRMMSKAEILALFTSTPYPFTYEFKNHSSEPNKIEIILKQDGDEVRLPNEDKNNWIDING